MTSVPFIPRPLSRTSGPREIVRQFTPNWFAATMGTGVLAIALALVPGGGPLLYGIGRGLWLFNIGLFALFTLLYAARWIFFFDGARRIFGHSVVSMFVGCIPMGLATIINGILIYAQPQAGGEILRIVEALWWADAVLSVIGDGSDNKEASKRLGISQYTAMTHRNAIMRKLGLHHSKELMQYALVHGYVVITAKGIYRPGFQRRIGLPADRRMAGRKPASRVPGEAEEAIEADATEFDS